MSVAYDAVPYLYDDPWLTYDSDNPSVTPDPRYWVVRPETGVTVSASQRNHSVSVVPNVT